MGWVKELKKAAPVAAAGMYLTAQALSVLSHDAKDNVKDHNQSVIDAGNSIGQDHLVLTPDMAAYLQEQGFALPGEKIAYNNLEFTIPKILAPDQVFALAVLDYTPKKVIDFVNGDFQILPVPSKGGDELPHIEPRNDFDGSSSKDNRLDKIKKYFPDFPFGIASAASDLPYKPPVDFPVPSNPEKKAGEGGWLDHLVNTIGDLFKGLDISGFFSKQRTLAYGESVAAVAPASTYEPCSDPIYAAGADECKPKATATATSIQNDLSAVPGSGSGDVKYDPDGRGILDLKSDVDWSNPDFWYPFPSNEFGNGGPEVVGLKRSDKDIYLLYVEREGVDFDKTGTRVSLGVDITGSNLPTPGLGIKLRSDGVVEIGRRNIPEIDEKFVSFGKRVHELKLEGYAEILPYKAIGIYPAGFFSEFNVYFNKGIDNPKYSSADSDGIYASIGKDLGFFTEEQLKEFCKIQNIANCTIKPKRILS